MTSNPAGPVVAPLAAPFAAPHRSAAADAGSRFWRTVWRTHFYAGILTFPFLGVLAITGLIILYTQPINRLSYGSLLRAPRSVRVTTLEQQRTLVERSYPDLVVAGVTPAPPTSDRSTMFAMKPSEGDGAVRQVFIEPGTGRVLGSKGEGDGIVGLANRLHGSLNNTAITVSLPSLAGLAGSGGAMIVHVALGAVLMEIFAGWALVLAASGLYLYWPRKKGLPRTTLVPRIAKQGRARWRDLHAIPGLVLVGILAFFVVTGLPWSGYWGSGWRQISSKVTPRPAIEQPPSAVVRSGDLDRFGNRIPWSTQDTPVPASNTPVPQQLPSGHNDNIAHEHAVSAGGAGSANTLSLDAVATIAAAEQLTPGYSIALPVDTPAKAGTAAVFGSFTITEPWPGRVQHEHTVYVDQFSGKTLGVATPGNWGQGALGSATEWGVQTHMGTQFGLINRVVMTFGCLALLWSVASALVMYTRRRRPGSIGAPRRPVDVKLAKRLMVILATLGIIYPLWGASVVAVLALDRFIVRRRPRLRRAFGMH